MMRRRKVKCTTCGNLYLYDHKGCPTCNGKMKETRKPIRQRPKNK